MILSTLLILLAGQSSAAEGTPTDAETQWLKTVQASRLSAEPVAPIESLRLHAEVLTRGGVQTNEIRVDLAFQRPHLIRFGTAGSKEVGRFGLKQREYWLRTGERTVTLQGREYEEDRRQIQVMHTLALNFIALADPAHLEVSDVELLQAPPKELPGSLLQAARRLRWLRLRSPDFALASERDGAAIAPGEFFIIEFGLAPDGPNEHLPVMAVVRDARRHGRAAAPMLMRMGRFRALDGFRVPGFIEVFSFAPGLPPRFMDKPGQEIYLLNDSTLRAALTREDFLPS